MWEPQRLHFDGIRHPRHTERRGPSTDRRQGGWLPGQPDRRQGPPERRVQARPVAQPGRRRGLPDRRLRTRMPSAPLPPLPVGPDLLPLMSHELRTPLTSIQGYAQLLGRRLRQRGATDDLLGPVNEIGAQARRLGNLVDELLDLSELAQPNARIPAYRLELAAVVREAAATVRGQTRKCRIVVEVAPPLPVRGDAERLRQLVVELLLNAVKYSPEGGEVRVQAWGAGEDVLLQVADQGEGVAPEHLSRLFEPFFQVTADDDPQQPGGLGLGLTLCHAIASRHGGRIWAESTPGEGTRLWVQLPRATS